MIGIYIRNFEIGEKWTQQYSAIFKLCPFGAVSISKSDFYDSTIFRDFLAEILFLVSYWFIEGFWPLPNSQNVFALKIRNSLSKIVFDQVSAFSELRRLVLTCSKYFLTDLKIDFRVEKKCLKIWPN